MLTTFFAERSWKFLARKPKTSPRGNNLKNIAEPSFWVRRGWFSAPKPNRFQSLFQTTYKYIKFWETFSSYLHANTRTNPFFNASWENRHSISFLQHFFRRNLFASGIHFTHVNTSQKFLSWNRKTSIKKHFPKKVILECAFELVQKLVWEHHQKNFRSESGKTLGIFLPKNFTEHLDVNFE